MERVGTLRPGGEHSAVNFLGGVRLPCPLRADREFDRLRDGEVLSFVSFGGHGRGAKRAHAGAANYFLSVRMKNSRTVAKLPGARNAPAFLNAAVFRIARRMRTPHKARMFALGGDAFPNDTQSLRTALTRGAGLPGAREGAVTIEGDFPSLEILRMNLTGVRLDARTPLATAPENAAGGFFARTLCIAAEPALLASVPIQVRLDAEDCVFAFGTAADGTRTASLQSCTKGTLDASAAAADLQGALLALARDAASAQGAEVESVRLTLDAESPRRIAVTAVAVAKAMFFTATLTIRGRIGMDAEFNVRLSDATCKGDGMIANLAAAQLRPRLVELEARTFSIRSFLPSGLQPGDVTLTGGAALRILATFGGKIKT